MHIATKDVKGQSQDDLQMVAEIEVAYDTKAEALADMETP